MTILGIDEVGRGCWAGPLVAGAVLYEEDFVVPAGAEWRLADSKVLTKKQRETADEAIRQSALAYGLGWVDNREIDELGLTASVALAMRRATDAVLAIVDDDSRPSVDKIIIDGSINYLPDLPQAVAIVKADGTVPAVSAASIIAKVARDKWMASEAERLHPGYGFFRHVGYGTKVHQAALAELGVSALHRRSFRPVAALC